MTETSPAPSAHADLRGVIAYLAIDGAARAADLYRRAFAAEEVARHPSDEKGRTMHVHLRINGGPVMLGDFYPEHGYPVTAPAAFTLHLQVDDPDLWWNRAVEAGLEVVVPLQKMFWGDRWGQLRDPYGVAWSIGGSA